MTSFQQAFVQALLAEAPPTDGPFAQPAFAVYRNTVLKGCIDALEANFPTVARLVGSDWFRSAALAYVRAHPPRDSRLLAYGDEDFAGFVQSLPSAADLPYLAGVAQADRLWRACHAAEDAPVLPAEALARHAPDALAARVLRPHPATQWAWFEGLPVASLWSHERTGEAVPDTLAWRGEGLLFTRGDGAVHWQPLPRAGCVFLDACAAGHPLAEAAQHALDLDPSTPLPPVLQQLLGAAAFTEEPMP
jgi:hypothetical protein